MIVNNNRVGTRRDAFVNVNNNNRGMIGEGDALRRPYMRVRCNPYGRKGFPSVCEGYRGEGYRGVGVSNVNHRDSGGYAPFSGKSSGFRGEGCRRLGVSPGFGIFRDFG